MQLTLSSCLTHRQGFQSSGAGARSQWPGPCRGPSATLHTHSLSSCNNVEGRAMASAWHNERERANQTANAHTHTHVHAHLARSTEEVPVPPRILISVHSFPNT